MSAAIEKLIQRANQVDSLVCVGLDSDLRRLPESFHASETPQYAFNRWIIESTIAYCSAVKINTAFYEARGEQGWLELRLTMDFLRLEHPGVFTICDAKRADIGNTSESYARAIFDELGFDAVTLHPYLGREALMPFLDRADKASIILCRTSNPGAGELQSLLVEGRPLWYWLAKQVATYWNGYGNCMLVAGATYVDELQEIRNLVGEMNLLVPGIGAQGGNIEAVVKAGKNSGNQGLIIAASRSIIFADDPATAARMLNATINQYRNQPV